MIPTGVEVAQLARETFLGETEIPGGQIFTDSILVGPINASYRLLYAQMMRIDERKARATAFYNLPAWTTYLSPVDMGLGTRMGAPKELWDRRVDTVWTATVLAINASTETTPSSVDLTVTNHGLQTGAQVITYNFRGMTPDISDVWHIEAVDANTIRLLGCTARAAATTPSNPTTGVGSTGVVSNSNEDWPRDPIKQVIEVEPRRQQVASNLTQWAWKDGIFRFPPSHTARQVKIIYAVSGDYGPDLTQSIGIDNSAEFLACYAAAIAANAKGANPGTAPKLFEMAVGNTTGDPGNADGGYLGALIRPLVHAQENVRCIMPPYRPRRWPFAY